MLFYTPRVFSQHFGKMTRPVELGIFALFYTKLGKTHYIIYSNKTIIKYEGDRVVNFLLQLKRDDPVLFCLLAG